MRFAFTEQQREFRDAVRLVLDNECTPADLRAAFESPLAPSERWTHLCDLGVVGLTVPEPLGGLGMHDLDLVLLLEEAGRAALPEPLMETTALTAPLLAESATDANSWLEAIAAGEVIAAVGIGTQAKTGLAGAQGADYFVVDHHGTHGREIHVVARAEVEVTPVATLDPTRRLGTVQWEPQPATVVATGPAAELAASRIEQRAAVGSAAQLLGLADRMITIAADYAKERKQFGKPIGSFQAVKHLLAGAQVKLEFARPMVYAASWSFTHNEPDAPRAASMAKAFASDAATEAARVSLQVHGAIGYTWECDLQLFLKRAWALAAAWGDAGHHRSLVLASLMAERG